MRLPPVFMMACLLVGGLGGCTTRPATSEDLTIAAIKELDGEVRIDDRQSGRPVVSVNFDAKGHGRYRPGIVTDDKLTFLRGFEQLKDLNLSFTDISDAGLVHLSEMTNLEALVLFEVPRITDAGLPHLKGLVNLRRLDLGYTKVTDEGLRHLSAFPKLERLNLYGTRITDAGLIHLERLNSLKSVSLGDDRNRITEAGVERLRKALPGATVGR